MNNNEFKPDEMLVEMLADVPGEYAARFAELVMLTDKFCDRHLNAEYQKLCRKMAVAVCQKGSPVLKGKSEGWAAGIVYAIGMVNFLHDPSQTPHMKSTQVAAGFGVGVSTMQAKAKIIREGLRIRALDFQWWLPSKLEDNPLVWLLKVNGPIMDIRMAPREAQVVAYNKGLIPYIPADRHKSLGETRE